MSEQEDLRYFEPKRIKEFAANAARVRDGAEQEACRVLLEEREYFLDLIRSFLDRDGCEYDHNRSCQMHAYYYLDPGTVCPQEEAKFLLAANGREL